METTPVREQKQPKNQQQDMGQDQEKFEEGRVARAIENQTAKMPSDVFLWGAGAAVAGSLTLLILGQKHISIFVGQWAPTLLLLGVYNKIVKVAGHDSQDQNQNQNQSQKQSQNQKPNQSMAAGR